jgi:hypothetical protein
MECETSCAICPDCLRIEVEHRPDLVVGRDWAEAIRLAEETAVSRDGISGLRRSIYNPPAPSPARSSPISAAILGKWKRKRTYSILGQLSECLTKISTRPVDTFFFGLSLINDLNRPVFGTSRQQTTAERYIISKWATLSVPTVALGSLHVQDPVFASGSFNSFAVSA